MLVISKAKLRDAASLTEIGKETFLDAHGHSASKADIDAYLADKYTLRAFEHAVTDPANLMHVARREDKVAGYSNIIFNSPNASLPSANAAKLDRLYVRKEFYGTGVARELFTHNIDLARRAQQSGVWLFVWIKNDRAIGFYKKCGFAIVGEADFKISATHSNPNHIMWLTLDERW